MKAAAPMMFLVTALLRVGTGTTAPLADLVAAPLLQAQTTGGFVSSDGAHYNLASRVGLFVDYKEMRPASGPMASLETGLPAMPPVRLGGVLVAAGIRFYFN